MVCSRQRNRVRSSEEVITHYGFLSRHGSFGVVVFFFFCLWTGNENRNRRPGHSCGPMSSKPRKRSLPARQKHQVARRSDTPSSAQQFQRATGSQWCDDEGNSLEWLEACGFTQEAARVRDRHRLRTDADDLCPGTPMIRHCKEPRICTARRPTVSGERSSTSNSDWLCRQRAQHDWFMCICRHQYCRMC